MVGQERGEIGQQRKEEEGQTKGTAPNNRRGKTRGGGESKSGKGERTQRRGHMG